MNFKWISSLMAAALIGGMLGWIVAPKAPAPRASRPAQPPDECKRFRARIATLEGEQTMLRAELDRMSGLLRLKRESDAQMAARGEDKLSPAEKRERFDRAVAKLKELVPALPSGEPEVFEGLRDVFYALAFMPADDPRPFREAYENATHPTERSILLPHVLRSDPEHATSFLKEELRETTDENLRTDLLDQLRYVGKPQEDPEMEGIYLQALSKESNPRAQRAAIDVLAQMPSEGAQAALLEYVRNGADPANREHAVRLLATNPPTASKLLETLAGESDERLRTIGECGVRLSEIQSSS